MSDPKQNLSPTEKAESKILQAAESRASYLDLSNLGLDTLPDSLWGLTGLKLLELAGNLIQTLPPQIGELKHLELLELSQNKLVSVPPELFSLRFLQSLFLRDNFIRELPSCENLLGSLIKLDVTNNLLWSLPEHVGEMNQLAIFYCDSNQLEELPHSFGRLTKLERFSASKNQLKSFPDSINLLQCLKFLDLSNNKLSVIPDQLSELSGLEELNLAGNSDLELPSELLKITGQESIRRRPVELVRAYKKTRGESGAQLREIKLLVVGRGGAGKTSLVKMLNHETFNRQEPETHGINIRTLQLACEDGPMTTRVWDFGGQVILHAMHEFFLTARSMYLLVLTEREDLANRDAQYWLQLIRVYAPNAPIIIALNKSAGRPQWDLDINQLGRKFGPVIGWTLTDCESGLGIDELRGLLVKAADSMPEPRKLFPKRWFAIKDEVSSMPRAFMNLVEFRSLCDRLGERDVDNQDELSGWLHYLGIALNYGRDPRLRDTTVLRPDWLANGIYAVLRANDLSQRCEVTLTTDATISEEALGRIYKAAASVKMVELAEYPEEKWAFILKLMGLFQLAFPLDPNSTKLLVPSLLTANEPDDAESALKAPVRWRYAMRVVPAALIPKFIVRTFALSEGCARWRRGCFLQFGMASAIVRVNSDESVIDIGVKGEPSDSDTDDLKKMIRGTFDDVFQTYQGIQVECQVMVENSWVSEALVLRLARTKNGAV